MLDRLERVFDWVEEIGLFMALAGLLALLGLVSMKPLGVFWMFCGVAFQVLGAGVALMLASDWKKIPALAKAILIGVVLLEQTTVELGLYLVGPIMAKGSPMPDLARLEWWLAMAMEPGCLLLFAMFYADGARRSRKAA